MFMLVKATTAGRCMCTQNYVLNGISYHQELLVLANKTWFPQLQQWNKESHIQFKAVACLSVKEHTCSLEADAMTFPPMASTYMQEEGWQTIEAEVAVASQGDKHTSRTILKCDLFMVVLKAMYSNK